MNEGCGQSHTAMSVPSLSSSSPVLLAEDVYSEAGSTLCTLSQVGPCIHPGYGPDIIRLVWQDLQQG